MVDHVRMAHRENRSEIDEEFTLPARLPLVDVEIDTNNTHSGAAPEDFSQVPISYFCHLITKASIYSTHLFFRRRA